jgi:hypothetical protein
MDISSEFDIDKGTIAKYIALHEIPVKVGYSISSGQKQIAEFVKSIGFDVQQNVKIFDTDKREIDIFVPEKNFGIEYDGLYFHGSDRKLSSAEKKIHQKKVIDAEKTGNLVIRITEEEWKESPELVKSIIRSKLGITEKIYARKCDLRIVDSKNTKQFLETTHLSGYAVSKVNLGLYYENELVAVCTFGKPRFEKNYEWEIIRFASKLNTTVVGGFQKILNYFRKNYTGSIITYADRRISNGNVYAKS